MTSNKKIKALANELINELVENHGYKSEGNCERITLWLFDEKEIEIEQSINHSFNRMRFNFKRREV